MLKLKTLGTGSSGNCYLLSTENETLILDCGIPIMEIKKGLDFDLTKVVGVLCTHGHADHNKSLEWFVNNGFHIMAPFEIGDVKRSHCKMGGFDITSFDLPHDGVWNSGFLIKVDGEKFLYATDFEYIKYSFKKMRIQHMLIECNYQNKYVDKVASNREHVLRGHAELETTIGVVKDNADSLRNVILCHISNGNGNPYEMVEEVQKRVKNANVDFAEKGKEFSLTDECPF